MHEFTAYIVDDDEFIIRALQRTLKRLVPHWHIHYFTDPLLLKEQLPSIPDVQLFISDRMMPAMQGESLLLAAKEHQPGAVRVLLTADTSAEIVVQDSSLIHHFLAKPFADVDFIRVFQCAERLASLPIQKHVRNQLGQMADLPILPAHFYQLQQICQDPQSDISQLGHVVGRDPVLVGKIYQLANSPFMGYSRPTNALEEALLRLGFDLVLGLAANLYCQQQLEARLNEQQHQRILSRNWQHASIAKVLARHSGLTLKLQDQIFMASLLGALGELVIAAQPDNSVFIGDQQSSFWPEADFLTAYMLTLWGFEPALCHGVLTQRQLRDLPDDSSMIAATLYCSHLLWSRCQGETMEACPVNVPAPLAQEFSSLWQQAETGQLRALW